MFRNGKENGPTMDSEGQRSRTRNSSRMRRKIGSTETENGSVFWNHFRVEFSLELGSKILTGWCFSGGMSTKFRAAGELCSLRFLSA